ncbi:sugar (pentulose or hexulose) kinase [Okibacterium sp. HSC-33S16]|nr:sugar (pentulose or hexulose) kinase [Okibacterium sp. HSC-33S16]
MSVASVGEEIVLVDATGLSTGTTPAWYTVESALSPEGPTHAEATWHKLSSIARKHPDRITASRSFTDIAGYVSSRLTGDHVTDAGGFSPLSMDRSHASRTGFYDPTTEQWDLQRFDRLGLPRELLPTLVSSGTVIARTSGEISANHGLHPDVPIVAGGHDHFCGAFGAGVRSTGDIYISVGTSESQIVLVDYLSDELREAGIDVGTYVDARHAYLHIASASGREFDAAVRDTEFTDSIDDLYRRMEVLMDSTHLSGERRANNIDLTVRPILQLLHDQADRAADRIDRLLTLAGRSDGRVFVGGSPASQPLWRQIRRAASAVPLTFLREPELSALGAALLAQFAVEGIAPSPPAVTYSEGAAHGISGGMSVSPAGVRAE